ncbi:hypothetical protein C8A00DRAFT_41536 [Chaetomidium leptoderma]|uniref:Glycine-rich cell wall structural protein 1 n=1 Tax=Chaetomidium leptoderma TaxID=669021 RepID=A0AAN6VQF7_9PEZI|nr:hypothetical protein C8A00DRAFT_41536 [Chaetomidium leptoderma]
MDTITNLTHAASKAIWGETQGHEEPVSGKMGNVSAGEPYDAGNIEPNEAALSSTEKKDNDNTSPATTTRTTGTTAPEPMPKPEVEAATKPRFVEEKPSLSETQREESQSQPTNPAGPAKFAPSAIAMRGDSTKAQNDTRPPAPSTEEATADKSHIDTSTTSPMASGTDTTDTATTTNTKAAATEKEETDTLDAKDPDIKLDGPGPRPLEEIAREHGGDAARVAAPSGSGSGSNLPEDSAGGAAAAAAEHQRRDSGKGLGGSDDNDDKKTPVVGTGEGTGEEYVKSSGLKADGGDFDASRPGAGREADRLLEEKGVVHHPGAPDTHHKTTPDTHHGTHDAHRTSTGASTGSSGNGADAGGNGKHKVGLKEKIKAKLHKSSTSA